jgi:hypothetical protein
MRPMPIALVVLFVLLARCGDDDGPTNTSQSQTGACDQDGACTVTTEDDCTGNWQGENTVCDPNPCPQPPMTDLSGTWQVFYGEGDDLEDLCPHVLLHDGDQLLGSA